LESQFCSTAASAQTDLIGRASIIDGDTLEIQLCPAVSLRSESWNHLAAFIGGRLTTCAPVTVDRYGRTVASCAVNGVDLVDWLVRHGLALDWPRYSFGRYSFAQDEARRSESGIYGQAALPSRGGFANA
jgi:endonuclease YncB( thermonuclease family)